MPVHDSVGDRLHQVVDAQIDLANSSPVRRWVSLLPRAAPVDILLRLARMIDGLVGEAGRIAEDYSGIILAHGR
jgi:hypothetical protein